MNSCVKKEGYVKCSLPMTSSLDLWRRRDLDFGIIIDVYIKILLNNEKIV